MRRRDSRILAIVLFVLPLMLWCQTDTGTITGMVRDTSGALVAQVKIGITDARTHTTATFLIP